MAAPLFTVVDARTAAEFANFNHPIPTVTGAVKRLLEKDTCKDAVRLLPVLSRAHGKIAISLMDIVFVGGGILVSNFKFVDKVMEQLAGKDVADGQTKGLDFDLHSNYAKWRQLLMVLHREATGVEKEEREEESQDVAIEDKAAWFKSTYHFALEPEAFSSGLYAKSLMKQGLGYALDARTDWRRAKPANGRRGEVLDDPKKKELPGKVHLGSGQDVYDCLIRKMMSILLLFGDADISKQGFASNSHGVVAGTVRWIALEDVFALKKACFGMQKLARDKAEALADWFEEKLSSAVKTPSLKTLSCAIREHLDVLEARIDSRAYSTPPATKRGATFETPAAPSKRQKKAAAKAAKAAEAAAAAGKVKKPPADGKKKKGDLLERMEGGNPAGLSPLHGFRVPGFTFRKVWVTSWVSGFVQSAGYKLRWVSGFGSTSAPTIRDDD
jgi:hypothetical protein